MNVILVIGFLLLAHYCRSCYCHYTNVFQPILNVVMMVIINPPDGRDDGDDGYVCSGYHPRYQSHPRPTSVASRAWSYLRGNLPAPMGPYLSHLGVPMYGVCVCVEFPALNLQIVQSRS